jgi:hypothetical protein
MMIPGQWEPRESRAVNATAATAPAAVAATERAVDPPIHRHDTATWLEVTIVTIALLTAMFLAMWASRHDRRLTLGHDASQDVASPVQHVVPG